MNQHVDQHQGSTLRRTLWSLWAWPLLIGLIIVWTPLTALVRLATAPFDKGRYWTGYFFRRVAVVHQKLNPLWSFSTSGQMPANPRQPFVAVSNHESFVDMILLSHLKWEMKWLSKMSIYRLPFLGWMMQLSGDVKLQRGVKSSIVAAMVDCGEHLKRNVSVMIFPEGTRSPDGELGVFKPGAFRLAIEHQVPILPIALHGTRTALHKHDWRFGVSKAEARVLAPIATTGMTTDDVAMLRDRVRDVIAAEVAMMRAAAAAADT